MQKKSKLILELSRCTHLLRYNVVIARITLINITIAAIVVTCTCIGPLVLHTMQFLLLGVHYSDTF
jgi:hypothetical protein